MGPNSNLVPLMHQNRPTGDMLYPIDLIVGKGGTRSPDPGIMSADPRSTRLLSTTSAVRN
jgi:hypothetical protein